MITYILAAFAVGVFTGATVVLIAGWWLLHDDVESVLSGRHDTDL